MISFSYTLNSLLYKCFRVEIHNLVIIIVLLFKLSIKSYLLHYNFCISTKIISLFFKKKIVYFESYKYNKKDNL